MTCAAPVVFRGPDGAVLKRVPCGVCRPCRIARAREWTTRMMHELEWWNNVGAFVTLTYDDEHLPGDGSLFPYDLECYLKRVRKAMEPGRIRFYAAGEYGERTQRPHYHAVLFGVGPEWAEMLEGEWGNGFVGVGSVTEHSIRYVADYVQSKLFGAQAERVYERRRAPFARMSQGIGRDWCDAHAEELRKTLCLQHRGHPVALPRYYARRLGVTSWDTLPARIEHSEEVIVHHQERTEGLRGPWFDWESVRASARQAGYDAEARRILFPRGKL